MIKKKNLKKSLSIFSMWIILLLICLLSAIGCQADFMDDTLKTEDREQLVEDITAESRYSASSCEEDGYDHGYRDGKFLNEYGTSMDEYCASRYPGYYYYYDDGYYKGACDKLKPIGYSHGYNDGKSEGCNGGNNYKKSYNSKYQSMCYQYRTEYNRGYNYGRNLKYQSTPSYNPSFWNDGGTIQEANNCYSYALNIITTSLIVPGSLCGQPIGYVAGCYSWENNYSCQYTINLLINGASCDGLTYLGTNPNICPAAGKNLAACILYTGDSPNGDPTTSESFHWYRLDSNGYWSHKPGGHKVTDRDDNGKRITNPHPSSGIAYPKPPQGVNTYFVGFFFVPNTKTQGGGRL